MNETSTPRTDLDRVIQELRESNFNLNRELTASQQKVRELERQMNQLESSMNAYGSERDTLSLHNQQMKQALEKFKDVVEDMKQHQFPLYDSSDLCLPEIEAALSTPLPAQWVRREVADKLVACNRMAVTLYTTLLEHEALLSSVRSTCMNTGTWLTIKDARSATTEALTTYEQATNLTSNAESKTQSPAGERPLPQRAKPV